MFVYIKECHVLENKCYTPNVLAETYIIYIFLVNVTFYLQKCHKNIRTKTFVSLKQNNWFSQEAKGWMDVDPVTLPHLNKVFLAVISERRNSKVDLETLKHYSLLNIIWIELK